MAKTIDARRLAKALNEYADEVMTEQWVEAKLYIDNDDKILITEEIYNLMGFYLSRLA